NSNSPRKRRSTVGPWKPRFAPSLPRLHAGRTSESLCWLPRRMSVESKICRSLGAMTSRGGGIRVIVLDTNVISEIFRPLPESRVVDWLASLEGDVAITSVTLAELLAGVRRLPDGRRRDELTRRIDAALAPYRGGRAVLPFDD